MAFHKTATFNDVTIEALNKPKEWNYFNMDNVKVASVQKEDDLHGFDLKTAVSERPDHLFVKIFAIKKDEVNDNGDAFSEEELKKAAQTFVGVPIFTNHNHDDIENAKGECVHSWYDEDKGGIYIVASVDKVAYPKLARGIEQGYVTGCFPPDAPVLMADGTEKNICDIEDGDYVISGKGNSRKVLGKREKNYNYPLLAIRVQGIRQPLVCTSYHNIYVYRLPEICGCGCGNQLIEHKDKRITNKNFSRKFQKGHGNRELNFNHQYIQKIKAHELQEGDFLIEPKVKPKKHNDITLEQAFLIGLFLAEGSFEKRKGERFSIIFNFSHEERDTLAFQCAELLEKAFPNHRNKPTTNYYPDASQTRVCLYGKDIAEWFYKRCGEYSDKKQLSKEMMCLDDERTASLIAGFIEGDGSCIKGKYYNIGIVSTNLISQLRVLLGRLGIRTQYAIKDDPKRWGYKPVYTISFGTTTSEVLQKYFLYKKSNIPGHNRDKWHSLDDIILRPVKSIEETDYNGKIFDIEVDVDHSYCVNHLSVSNTSMGTSVDHSLCSICHNFAKTSEDYCSHIKNSKTRKYSGKVTCQYHSSSDVKPDEPCPLCGSTKDNTKTYTLSDHQVYEHNYGLKFVENSFVVNPACHECGVECVLHVPEFTKKVAQLSKSVDRIIKTNESNEEFQKVAGAKELNELKESMTRMEDVVQSMLKQKEHVSMEYVSDLVKAMSDVQNILDELTEMGYAQLPSPDILNASQPDIQEPVQPPIQPVPQTPKVQPSGIANQQELEGLGTVTTPKFSSDHENKIKESSAHNSNTINNSENPTSNKGNNMSVNPTEKEGQMSTQENVKVSQAVDQAPENQEVITEKQFDNDANPISERKGEAWNGITESKEQIGRETDASNDTTSDSPQKRNGTYETITENQMDMATDGAVVHYKDAPDVITEKQWTDMSRLVSGKLSEDYTSVITDAQIRELLSNHMFVIPEVITEGQMKDINRSSGIKRWANKEYTNTLAKMAINAISDAVSTYHKSPDEIKQAMSFINDDDKNRQKVAFLTLINSLPHKTDSMKSFANRVQYFSKTASKHIETSTIDSLILAVASNAQHGVKVEDVYDFIEKALSNKVAMAKVHENIKKASKQQDLPSVDKQTAFTSALIDMNKEKDGLYTIQAHVEKDLGFKVASIKDNKKAFIKKLAQFANDMVEEDLGAPLVVVPLELKIYEDDTVELVAKDSEFMTDEDEALVEDDIEFNEIEEPEVDEVEVTEDFEGENEPAITAKTKETKTADKRENIVKKAQLMGGEMGGQGGLSQAPGAGATMPQAPPMDQPGMESFTEDTMETDEFGGDEDLEPAPPGSMCPVCGSNDVDIIKGEWKCNNCSSEGTISVDMKVTNWAGTTPEEGGKEEEETEEFEGEGFEMPGTEAEAPAVAASCRLKPEALKKLASQKIKLGHVSPANGQTNTIQVDKNEFICLDTGTKYRMDLVAKKDNPKVVYARWSWKPKVASQSCPSCMRAKKVFASALEQVGSSAEKFDKMSMDEKSQTILKMKKAGAFNMVKTASKEAKVSDEIKVAYGIEQDKFPIESCIEKLARRYGKDALAISGPCEGNKLAECVCNQLKNAKVYTTKIAYKLADVYSDKCGTEECIEDQVKRGLTLKDASTVCSALKVALAEPEDMFVEELSETVEEPTPEGPDGIVNDVEEDIDPFANEDLVTLELPKDLVEEVDKAFDIALGENPEEEEHHQDDTMEDVVEEINDVTEETPEDITEETTDIVETPEDVTEDAVDTDDNEETEIEEENEEVEEEKPETDQVEEEVADCKTKPAEEMVDDTAEETNDAMETSQTSYADDPDKTVFTVTVEKEDNNEEDEDTEYDSEEDLDDGQFVEGKYASEGQLMKSKIGKAGKVNLDLSTVKDAINKKAQTKTIEHENVQDSEQVKPYSEGEDGSTMGHEQPPKSNKPQVPTGDATMGKEPADLDPKGKPQPEIPVGSEPMGHEEEAGLEGGDDRYTGGDQGAGKAATASSEEEILDEVASMRGFRNSKEGISKLAERILKAKKLDAPEAVSKDKDIQPISGDSAIGGEENFSAETPENVKSDNSLMGHEKETLGDKPDSPKDLPDIPADNQTMGQEGEDKAPEKQTKEKGTVIAKDESGNAKESEAHAIRVAGRMVKAGYIEADDLSSKIQELKQYQPAQIKDFEKSIFASKKGLDTVSEGLTQPVIINEASNQREEKDGLIGKLSQMFTLDKRVKSAEMDPNADLRDAYRR